MRTFNLSLNVEFDEAERKAMEISITALAQAVDGIGAVLPERVNCFFDDDGHLREDLGDLFQVQSVTGANDSDAIPLRFSIQPGATYFDLVAAVGCAAGDIGFHIAQGWPVLSSPLPSKPMEAAA